MGGYPIIKRRKDVWPPEFYVMEQPMTTTNELLTERGKTHGDFTDHANITQQLKADMEQWKGWANLTYPQKEALDMIAHKIGRILAGNPNYKDHWDDIAGYAKLVADRCPS